jgi:hypothetical protein
MIVYGKLFRNCLTDNLGQVRSELEQLEEQQSLSLPILPPVTLAAAKGHV